MAAKEAKARIKINKLLEEAGWRFLDDASGKANIVLEPNVKLTKAGIDALGENFETVHNGFIDFLLLDSQGYPLIVLEAKAEDKNPLIGKEQARNYAKSLHCRFVILSNGNLHYFWDLEQGNPHIIMRFPNPDSIKQYQRFQPNPQRLITEIVSKDYIALTQMPGYTNAAGWKNEIGRPEFIAKNRLRLLRDYQKHAVHAIQDAVAEGKSRFLFEMATGTGKTLTAAAVIKLFLRTGNARRVLFLVDRLELEDQANKAFVAYLKNDYTSIIYKERRDEWRSAEIVVTTVQSLLFNDKYQRLFSPTDFDLVISDEAHRSIGGNARAVFEYFVGYKLGLTATPKDYLKQLDSSKTNTCDPREYERRLLLDTYRTFGCETGEPTFRYSLLDGVRDGFLINPVVVDARSDITTQLLSDKGYAVAVVDGDGNEASENFYQKDFEKNFFSEATNRLFCETFMRNALRDPVSGETGKSIVFAVSQNHAAKLTQMLNELADAYFPGKYQSDFAVQVTSLIPEAQQYTINFANNNLLGSANFDENYRTSKARVCVTVGMMTTGYDCPDILNLAMMRPIFSPQDFVQIKGRGTRKHDFLEQLFDPDLKRRLGKQEKSRFKLFDFFANCEYFEEKFNYDELLQLPQPGKGGEKPVLPPLPPVGLFQYGGADKLASLGEHEIGEQGMKIDRMLFNKFEEKAQQDTALKTLIDNEQWDQAADYVQRQLFDKPADFFTLEGLRRVVGMDRRLNMRELLEKVFGLIPKFKSKDELLEDEFQKFLLDLLPEELEQHADAIVALKNYFKAYATDRQLRYIISKGQLTELNVNPNFTMADFKAVPAAWRKRIPEYVQNYVPLDHFN
ncbi:MAG: DEAD/DEAH box helicase family protein [Nitrosomonas sp.]|nr:DEAD/DEAH box helicase family protein [Nitrosomonas sp.]